MGQLKVLVVDDDAVVNKSIRDTLESYGMSATAAFDGVEALACLRASVVDLVICDLVMPVMDGLETIGEIQAAYPEIKIIAISGGSPRGKGPSLDDASAAGADAVMAKPLSARKLLRLIEDIRDQPSRHTCLLA
ncbi:MAG: response regulator [Alphaproteobacteria bacterium]|nr:response regulator [Alphaproteobacteria bacterium]